jgi:hypothetical protein
MSRVSYFLRHIIMTWNQDIPDDPTGELDKVEAFVEDNLNICKWVALAVVGMEVSKKNLVCFECNNDLSHCCIAH